MHRELAGGGVLAAPDRGSKRTPEEKRVLDQRLRTAGFILIDLPGNCIIETE